MPNDPNMPGGPGGGGAGGQNPPFDPNMANVFDKMNATLDSIDGKLKSMAQQTGAMPEDIDEATKKMHEFFRVSTNVEEAHKAINDFAKKRRNLTKGELADVTKSRKELTALEELYKKALAGQKQTSKETKAWEANLKRIHDLMKDLGQDGELTEAQWKKVTNVFEEAEKNIKAIDKAMSNLSRTSAGLKGMQGIMSSMGIGKGVNARVEKRFQQIEEVKEAVKQSREMRQTATKKHMTEKREKTLADLAGAGVDPKSDVGLGKLADAMGFKAGHKKRGAFMAGEKAGGEAAVGAEG